MWSRTAKINSGKVIPHVNLEIAICAVCIAQRPVVIEAATLRSAIMEHHTRVHVASVYGHHSLANAKVDGWQAVAHAAR
eukprot:6392103-Amphidinium_carterae.1